MRWIILIILALTLGASITSVIHGVFMLFGSLSISGGAAIGIPSTWLASLPIAAAVLALIGGVMAFNQSRWGALFLMMATVVCAFAPKDIWLYGGLYFFAALLCLFLRPRKENIEALYNYEDEDFNLDSGTDFTGDDYYAEEESHPTGKIDIDTNNIDDDIRSFQTENTENEAPKVRRRTSKSCPTCGAIVSRDHRFCPTCGTRLLTDPSIDRIDGIEDSDSEGEYESATGFNENQIEAESKISQSVNNILTGQVIKSDEINNYSENGGDDMQSVAQANPNYKVFVRSKRGDLDFSKRPSIKQETVSYQEFSKYTRRGKKPKRSAGRRILSMLLLIGAVGGALYFLLGLRKLPPGDLPPMVRPEVITVSERSQEQNAIAQPVEVVVAENILPNFTPDRNPKNGIITGNGVNVRADHSTGSRSITKLNNNTRVEILDSWTGQSGNLSGTWYQIRTGGREGWVYGRYLQPVGSGLPSGYSNALLKSIGNNRAELIESLGQPTRSTSSSIEWPGLSAGLRGDDITRLRLSSSNHELQNGLKTGMSQTALLQIMGYPSSMNSSQRTMQYNENGKTGLSIQLNRDGLISTITVNEVQ